MNKSGRELPCVLCKSAKSRLVKERVCLDCQEEHWIDESGSLFKTTLHIAEDGTKEWTSKGKLHRTHGPAVERADGTKYWYLKGKLHRTDGPAAIYASGTKYWYLKGKLHRTDGPAIELPDGTKRWCLEGKRLTESEWEESS